MTKRWLVSLLIAATALSSVSAEAQRMGGRFERSSEAPDNTPPPPPPVFRGNASAPAPSAPPPSAPVFQRQAPSQSNRAPDAAPAPQYQRRGGGNDGGNGGGGVWQGRFDNRNRDRGEDGAGRDDNNDGGNRWRGRGNPSAQPFPPQQQPPVVSDGRQGGRRGDNRQGDVQQDSTRDRRDGEWNDRRRNRDGRWNRDQQSGYDGGYGQDYGRGRDGDRYDNRGDYRRDHRGDGRRYDNRYDNRHGGDHDRRWDHGWRNDRRYDWRGYRNTYRDRYRLGRYYAPYRHWNYRQVSIGFSLWPLFYSDHYWINDPGYYRLPPAYGPYRWVRYYGDALLVDIRTGEVVDVINDFFW